MSKMKKRVVRAVLGIVFFLSILLVINLVSALGIQLSKQDYFPGETLQAEIPDVFIGSLKTENLGIYKEGSIHKTPVTSGIIKSENKYLYYAILPDSSDSVGSYSLKIENIKYQEAGEETQATVIKNFSIISTNSSYLSFNPGAIYATSDFSIKIKSYNNNQQIKVEFPEASFNQSFTLGLGNEKNVYISISKVTSYLKSNIKINSYSLPVIISPKIIYVENSSFNESSNLPLNQSLLLSANDINAAILENLDYYFHIFLYKNTSKSIKNINLSSSSAEIKINPNYINDMRETETINITINSKKDIKGYVKIFDYNSSIIVPINITITKNQSNVNFSTQPENQNKTCSMFNGVKCDYLMGEQCSGVETYAYDGICCLAECKTESSSKAWIWGLLILAVVAIGLWFLYKKSNKGLGKEKPKEILNKRAEDYEKRVNPKQEKAEEVDKSLTKT